MPCERCKDPNNLDTHEYTITKPVVGGTEARSKRIFCAECAQAVKDAGFKLTGGKREAEPEASTESDVPQVDVPPEPTPEPVRRRRS